MQSDEPLLPREKPRARAAHGPPEQPDVPDPFGPPRPVTSQSDPGPSGAVVGITVLAAAGATFLLLGSLARPTMGATRSSQLQWEQRQAEIDRAIEQAEVCEHVPIRQSRDE